MSEFDFKPPKRDADVRPPRKSQPEKDRRKKAPPPSLADLEQRGLVDGDAWVSAWVGHEKPQERGAIGDRDPAFERSQGGGKPLVEFQITVIGSHTPQSLSAIVVSQIFRISLKEANRLLEAVDLDLGWPSPPSPDFLAFANEPRKRTYRQRISTSSYHAGRAYLLGIRPQDLSNDERFKTFREPPDVLEDADITREMLSSGISNEMWAAIRNRYHRISGHLLALDFNLFRQQNRTVLEPSFSQIVSGLVKEQEALESLSPEIQRLLGTPENFLRHPERYTQLLRIGNLLDRLPLKRIEGLSLLPVRKYTDAALDAYENACRRELEAHLQERPTPLGFDGHWIPSTNTMHYRNGVEVTEEKREEHFRRIINGRSSNRDADSDENSLDAFYFDVLAPAGPTVNVGNASAQQSIFGGRDALEQFTDVAAELGREIAIVAWIEGTNRVTKNSPFYERLNVPDNPNTPEEEGDAILGPHPGGGLVVDILDPEFFNPFISFLEALCQRYGPNSTTSAFKEVILDDHFGIDKQHRDIMKEKYKKKAGEKNQPILDYLRDRITTRLGEVKSVLDTHNVILSVSAHLFDFDSSTTDKAMGTALQDVATWIRKGLISKEGQINVQLPPGVSETDPAEPEDVKKDYDKFIATVETHLNGYNLPNNPTGIIEYIANFPRISVSLYREGGMWSFSLGQIQEIIHHIGPDPKIEVQNSTTQYTRTIPVEVIGFDALDFE